jgi:peroxiredoxin
MFLLILGGIGISGTEQTLLVAIAVLSGLILLSLWAVLYWVIKQQGRLLLRQDDLENRIVHGSLAAVPESVSVLNPSKRAGLAVGATFPPFRLPDITGQKVSLEEFRGKRVLLVNWSSHCGFCNLIAADLARLGPELQKRNVQILLVAHGDADANRKFAEEQELHLPILLQRGIRQSVAAFRRKGTPVAYLLTEQGHVASPLAVGAEQVSDLVYDLATAGPTGQATPSNGWTVNEVQSNGTMRNSLPGERSLSTSKLERSGLKAGTPAPRFSLPDIYGRTVSLDEYRGKRVLLVFSDPQCGPCERLAPYLVDLHREHRQDKFVVVMVGRGDPDENRRKAEVHGFEFPVLVQRRWELSKEYGIFHTPVAFLVNEDGLIVRDVAKGVDEIRDLASLWSIAIEQRAG